MVSLNDPLTNSLLPREVSAFLVLASTTNLFLFFPIPTKIISSFLLERAPRSVPFIIHVAFPLSSAKMVLSEMPYPSSRSIIADLTAPARTLPFSSLRDTSTLYPLSISPCSAFCLAVSTSPLVRRFTASSNDPLNTLCPSASRVTVFPATTTKAPLLAPSPRRSVSELLLLERTSRFVPLIIQVAFPFLS